MDEIPPPKVIDDGFDKPPRPDSVWSNEDDVIVEAKPKDGFRQSFQTNSKGWDYKKEVSPVKTFERMYEEAEDYVKQ